MIIFIGIIFIKLLLLLFCSASFVHKPQIWLATHIAEYRKLAEVNKMLEL